MAGGLSVGALGVLAAPSAAVAEPAAAAPWSDASPKLADEVRREGTLVLHVTVPLCHNAQIDCAAKRAGDPDDLDHNLYWGAIFGMRKFFDRPASGYERVSREAVGGPVLERAVYRKWVGGDAWGREPSEPVELLVVFDAFHGDEIDEAVDQFWGKATGGGVVRFRDGELERTLKIDVAGYAGHNRLMDGKRLPTRPSDDAAVPSFVLACYSESYFGDRLTEAGSKPLLLTQALIAPEAYVVEGFLAALAQNASPAQIRRQSVAQYAKWQSIDYGVASGLFARAERSSS